MRIVTPTIYPRLGCNEVIAIKGERYRAEFWYSHLGNYYEFKYLGENGLTDFTRSEKDVSQAITDKLIKRL